MKKSVCILFASVIWLYSCTKAGDKDRDTLPPVVIINGNSTDNISLNTAYPDPGATATDKTDGTVQVTSDYSSTNPNVDSMGSYTVTYTAKDNAGNKGYGYRTIIVENAASSFAGNYIVTSIEGIDTTVYNQTVSYDKNLNNRIHFNDFGHFTNNSHIYANIVSGVMTLPLQYAINIGYDNGQPCDVVNHSFESTNCTLTGNGFIIEYTDIITAPLSCQATTNHTAIFVKQ